MLQSLRRQFVTFVQSEDGPTAVEYAVMLALIIVVCISAITAQGSNASNTFTFVSSKVGTSGSNPGAQKPEAPPPQGGGVASGTPGP